LWAEMRGGRQGRGPAGDIFYGSLAKGKRKTAARQGLGRGRQSSTQHDRHAAAPALRGQDASWLTLPGAGGCGETALPDAWRRRRVGARIGNRNALKQALHTREAIARRCCARRGRRLNGSRKTNPACD